MRVHFGGAMSIENLHQEEQCHDTMMTRSYREDQMTVIIFQKPSPPKEREKIWYESSQLRTKVQIIKKVQ